MLESYCLLWLGTLLAAILAIPIAGQLRGVFGFRLTLAPPGTASMAALIAANNIREAAVPLFFRGPQDRHAGGGSLIVGDVVVGASLAVNVAARRTRTRRLRPRPAALPAAMAAGVGRTRTRPRRLAASSPRATGPLRARPARDRRRDRSCASPPSLRHTRCPRHERHVLLPTTLSGPPAADRGQLRGPPAVDPPLRPGRPSPRGVHEHAHRPGARRRDRPLAPRSGSPTP